MQGAHCGFIVNAARLALSGSMLCFKVLSTYIEPFLTTDTAKRNIFISYCTIRVGEELVSLTFF